MGPDGAGVGHGVGNAAVFVRTLSSLGVIVVVIVGRGRWLVYLGGLDS